MLLNWTHRLTQLGPAFYTRLSPTPLSAPVWASRNLALLQALDWPDQLLGDPAAWAGNALLAADEADTWEDAEVWDITAARRRRDLDHPAVRHHREEGA